METRSKPVKVKIKRMRPDGIIPRYHSEHCAGMDLAAALDGPLTLKSLERAAVPTGLAIEIPAESDLYEKLKGLPVERIG